MSTNQIPISELKKDRVLNISVRDVSLTLNTTWGLFSPEGLDEGTRRLVEKVDIKPTDTILDLGCGYGPIGLILAKLAPQGFIHLVDKDFVAVEYAKKNAAVNGISNVNVYLSNGFDQVPPNVKFNSIVSNLPAKISKEYFWILFEEAKQHLIPGGKIYVVTIAGLRRFIEKNFRKIFGNYALLDSKGTYFVACAEKDTD